MKAIIFWEEGFPFRDTPALSCETVLAAVPVEIQAELAGLSGLADALRAQPVLFVHPYGSAFPAEAWPAFLAFLQSGGNWVNLGGSPVSHPVVRVADGWRVEAEQRAYGKALCLKQAFPLDLTEAARQIAPQRIASAAGLGYLPGAAADLPALVEGCAPRRAWALQVGLAQRDAPEDGGAPRPWRTGELRPLVHTEQGGRTVAAPVVVLDRLFEGRASGRWVLANYDASVAFPAALIRALCAVAVEPPVQLFVAPTFACYTPSETPTLTVEIQTSLPGPFTVELHGFVEDAKRPLHSVTASVVPGERVSVPLPITESGMVTVTATARGGDHPTASATTGFWQYDPSVPPPFSALTVNRDYFLRDGLPMPITGTTYMASDTHRDFLFEPNPVVWDEDFARMAAAGVNLVRTGFWRGWRRAMPTPGAVDETVLRALTAFFLTAARHGIPVIFTFFSFLPEAWGGENPYLAPSAVAAQSAFVAGIARRFAGWKMVLWDLINEPSFSAPEHIWQTRPNYDGSEQRAWREWLTAGGVSDATWRARWGLPAGVPLDLPPLPEFDNAEFFDTGSSRRASDYHRFAQAAFRTWAQRLVQAIRAEGDPSQLITVGQDEGGTHVRPNPHFFGAVVDFTSNHSWWQNDSLLWDSVITKTPDRPNLIQETGIMFSERLGGGFQRTPEQARNLLEQKMALSFAAGCAGFVQWLWNSNPYLDSDNEAAIGFLRADGSEKPELAAFAPLARFFAANAHRMQERSPEPFCLVIPHSNLFSVRDTATPAVRRAVRALEYHLGIPCRAVSEYHAEATAGASHLLLPSPGLLSEACWQTLLARVAEGATLLVTGSIDADEYGRPVPRLARFGLHTEPRSVARSERLRVSNKGFDLTFVNPSGHLEKSVVLGTSCESSMWEWQYGRGRLLHCPLPVELAASEEQTAQVYRALLEVPAPATPPGLLAREVRFRDSSLWLFVNECACPLPVTQGELSLTVPAERIALAFVEHSGTVADLYVPH